MGAYALYQDDRYTRLKKEWSRQYKDIKSVLHEIDFFIRNYPQNYGIHYNTIDPFDLKKSIFGTVSGICEIVYRGPLRFIIMTGFVSIGPDIKSLFNSYSDNLSKRRSEFREKIKKLRQDFNHLNHSVLYAYVQKPFYVWNKYGIYVLKRLTKYIGPAFNRKSAGFEPKQSVISKVKPLAERLHFLAGEKSRKGFAFVMKKSGDLKYGINDLLL